MWWLLFGLWLVSALFGARMVANWCYRDASGPFADRLDGEDWFFVGLFGVMGFIWGPILVAGYVLRFPLMRVFVPARAAEIREEREREDRLRRAESLAEAAEMFADDPLTRKVLLEAVRELRAS